MSERPRPGGPWDAEPPRSAPVRTGRFNVVLLVLLAAVVNLPVAHSTWTDWRVARDGVEVQAAVVDQQALRPGSDDASYVLVLDLPDSADADADAGDQDPTRYRVVVDQGAYDRAVADGEVTARVLPDRPQAFTVEGQVTSNVTIWIAAVADVLLLLTAWVLWRRSRERRRAEGAEGDAGPVSPV